MGAESLITSREQFICGKRITIMILEPRLLKHGISKLSCSIFYELCNNLYDKKTIKVVIFILLLQQVRIEQQQYDYRNLVGIRVELLAEFD